MFQVPEAIPLSEIHIEELQSYVYVGSPEIVAAQTVNGIEDCQILMQPPRPNIALYLECLVADSQVNGLCFKKASKMLVEIVNLGVSLKVKIDASYHALPIKEKLFKNREAGIRRTHSTWYVHSDVYPILWFSTTEPRLSLTLI